MVKDNILTKGEKISLANKKRWSNLENRKKQAEKTKMQWQNPEMKSLMSNGISKAKKGVPQPPHSEATKLKQSINNGRYWLGKRHTGEWRKNVSNKMKIYRAIDEVKNKSSKVSKELWKNEDYKEKVIVNALKGSRKRPTSLEKKWINIFKRKNLPYKYVGDGSVLIGFKNPDFVNVDGSKICIEVRPKVMCQFWNKTTPEEYERNRIAHFKKYGWDCIVIWDETNY